MGRPQTLNGEISKSLARYRSLTPEQLEHRNQVQAAWRAANADRIKANKTAWVARKKEEDPDYFTDAARRWREKHDPEVIKAKRRDQYRREKARLQLDDENR